MAPCTGFPLNFRTPPLLGASGHGHPDTPRHVRTRLPNVHFCPAVRRLPGAGDLAPHPSGWIFGLVRSLARFSGVAPLPLHSFLMSLLRRRKSACVNWRGELETLLVLSPAASSSTSSLYFTEFLFLICTSRCRTILGIPWRPASSFSSFFPTLGVCLPLPISLRSLSRAPQSILAATFKLHATSFVPLGRPTLQFCTLVVLSPAAASPRGASSYV